jgi:hypothetical protein
MGSHPQDSIGNVEGGVSEPLRNPEDGNGPMNHVTESGYSAAIVVKRMTESSISMRRRLPLLNTPWKASVAICPNSSRTRGMIGSGSPTTAEASASAGSTPILVGSTRTVARRMGRESSLFVASSRS